MNFIDFLTIFHLPFGFVKKVSSPRVCEESLNRISQIENGQVSETVGLISRQCSFCMRLRELFQLSLNLE